MEIHIWIGWWNKECPPKKAHAMGHANGSTTNAFSSCWEASRSIKITKTTMEQNSHCRFVNELYTSSDSVKGHLVSHHWLCDNFGYKTRTFCLKCKDGALKYWNAIFLPPESKAHTQQRCPNNLAIPLHTLGTSFFWKVTVSEGVFLVNIELISSSQLRNPTVWKTMICY